MIRKVLIAICFGMIGLGSRAQHMPNRVNTYSDEGSGTGFRKENLFVGGGLGLGFGSYSFNVGVNPEVGYSLTSWLDAGIVANFDYTSFKADPYYNGNIRTRRFSYGGGAFARVYILPFLFVMVQPEFNWLSVNQKDMNSGQTANYSANAPSLLLGIGYGQRVVGQSNFYISLAFDAINNKNSPYNDYNGHPLPVIKAGFDIFVHHSR